ncbi:MAG: cation diffusion facilitator family transporter [Burkholderiales bacterium]|nr:cation diffusion facilitator family transporter [Burkholderiales bacterium]
MGAHHHASPREDGQGHRAAAGFGRAFAIGIALNIGFVVVEVVAGWRAGSLALLSDAGHNLSDVLSLALAWGAAALATRRPSPRFTYGLRGTTIMAALANALLLMIACGAITLEAIERLRDPALVASDVVIVVAAIGVVVNGLSAALFASGRHADLNVRGAFLHLAGDAAVSLGVVVAAIAMRYTGWLWLDPAASLVIVAVIVWTTWSLFRDSLGLSLQGVPASIRPEEVRAYLASLPGVVEVHDLHIWGMSTTDVALTAHLVIPGGERSDAFLAHACRELDHRFGIAHATLQIELGDGEPCALAPDHVV